MPERLTTDPAEVAQARTRRALETVERAQGLLDGAAQDLCSVQGMREGWELVLNLHERVRAGWRTLDRMRSAKGAALTLDPLNADSLKREGAVPAVLRPQSEQLTCPGLGDRPCALPVRSRWDIAQELADAPARAWKYGAQPVDEGDAMPQAEAALYALEKGTARLSAELDGLCERCASAAAFFVSDVPRGREVPELPVPPESRGRGLRVTVAQLAGMLAVPLYQVCEALGELRRRGGSDAP